MSERVGAVAVVVPAHDEEDLLGACLDSVAVAARAARAAGVRVDVHVVLDDCRDRSAVIARRHDVRVHEIHARSVGAARSVGVTAALALLEGLPPEGVWTAHTDADSWVPPNWLIHQLALAREGADVVVGTVRPDFRDLSAEQTAAWWATHTPGAANGHVHGANLGIRASHLLDAGGFPQLSAHEDVRLVERIREAGGRFVATDAAWVRTSGRQHGRAPEGYARYLREDLVALARRLAEAAPHETSMP